MSTPIKPTEADRELAYKVWDAVEWCPTDAESAALDQAALLIAAHVHREVELALQEISAYQPRSRPAVGPNGGETDAGRYGTDRKSVV